MQYLFFFLEVNDRPAVVRSCYWENLNETKNACMNNDYPSYIKIKFCETCSSDGCNGAAMDPVIENGNTIGETTNAIDEKKNVSTETSTKIPSKSNLSSDHEVLIAKNVTACNLGSVQDDNDEFVVELLLKIKKSQKRN